MIVGIGIDAVEIDRVGRMFADKGERMLHRLFTGDELSYINDKAAPAQHLAVRLAAKEAAYKALSGNDLARGIGWRDVEVVSRADGSPYLRLHGHAEQRYRELEATSVHVSLTHSLTTAVAVVIVER
jgi:holo-[acyl-carrier protein] synthase